MSNGFFDNNNPLNLPPAKDPYWGVLGTSQIPQVPQAPKAPMVDPSNPLGMPPAKDPYSGIFSPGGHQGTNPYDIVSPRQGNSVILGTPRQSGPNQAGDVMGRIMTPTAQGMADIGSALGGLSQGEKADRVVRGNYTQGFDRMMLDREMGINRMGLDTQEARNRNESDALKKLQQTSYIAGGGSNYEAPQVQLNGQTRQAPLIKGVAPRAMSQEEMQGASDLRGQVMGRLQPGGSFSPSFNYQPTPLSEYTQPGKLERVGSYGGAISSILGGLSTVFGQPQAGATGVNAASGAANQLGIPGLGGAGSKIAGFLGKAAPIAGAVTGGLGLMKDRGLGGNVMNGVTTGASIGSIVPGLGTAVGAGIGGLVGALRGIGGGPSAEEKAGRDVAGVGRQSIIGGATPQQRQEAMQAGQQNPDAALMHIVLRDRFGGNDQIASQLVSQLFQAEKQGPQAVQSVLAQIMSAAGGR